MNIKKQTRTIITLLLIIVASAVTTSCDNDVMEANTLRGDWYGDFGMEYSFVDPRTGRTHVFECYDTYIRFYQSGYSNRGTGTQVDYYKYGPYERIYYDFDWYIVNGVIKLRYHWATEWDADIYNYVLTSNYFEGRFQDGVRFNMRAIYDYNWNFSNRYYKQYHYGCDPYEEYGFYPYGYYDNYVSYDYGYQSNSHYGYKHNSRSTAPQELQNNSDSIFIPAPKDIIINKRSKK